MLMAYYWIVDI